MTPVSEHRESSERTVRKAEDHKGNRGDPRTANREETAGRVALDAAHLLESSAGTGTREASDDTVSPGGGQRSLSRERAAVLASEEDRPLAGQPGNSRSGSDTRTGESSGVWEIPPCDSASLCSPALSATMRPPAQALIHLTLINTSL